MDFSRLISRVKSILLTSKTEWPLIAAEPATSMGLYTGYILVLAAVPAVCEFLRLSIFGVTMPYLGTAHVSTVFALEMALRSYLSSLIAAFLVAWIVNALAPTFGGQKNSVQSLKVVAYSFTASWVAGIAVLLGGLGFLIMFVALIYGIYLMYLGLPPTMKCPPEKAAGYTVVTLICTIVLGAVLMYALRLVGVGSGMTGMTGYDRTSHATFDTSSPAGKLGAWAQGMAAAGKQLDSAQKTGDTQAAANAVGQMMANAVSGGQQVEALAPERLKSFLPDTLGGLKRTEASAERNGALGMQVATATARYGDENPGGRLLKLEVTDMGGAKGVLAVANRAHIEEDRQTDTGYVKTYHQGNSMIHEQWDNTSKEGEYSAVIAERFMVKVEGSGPNIDVLKSALASVDVAGLAALKDEGVKPN